MFEPYKLDIKISLIDAVSKGMDTVIDRLKKADRNVELLNSRLERAGKLIAAGGIIRDVGLGGLGSLSEILAATEKFGQQLAVLQTMGMNGRDVAAAETAAWETTRQVVGSVASDNLRVFGEMRQALHDGAVSAQDIAAVLPVVQRLQPILNTLHGKPVEDLGPDLIRAINARANGNTDPSWYARQAELAAVAAMRLGGDGKVAEYLEAVGSGAHYSDEFVYQYLPTLAAASAKGPAGGKTPGDILEAVSKVVLDQKIPQESIGVWREGGLIASGKLGKGADGKEELKPGAIKDAALFQANPFRWVVTDGASAVAALQKDHGWSREEAVDKLFGNSGAAFGILDMLERQQDYVKNARDGVAGDSTYAAYQKLAATSPAMAQAMPQGQWENIQARLGFVILPRLIPILEKFTDSLGRLGGWLDAHPALAELGADLVIFFSVIAVAGSVISKIGKLMEAGAVLQSAALWISAAVKLPQKLFIGISLYRMAADSFLLALRGSPAVLGWVIGAGLALAVGWAVGQIINRLLPDSVKDSLGSGLTHVMAFLGSDEAKKVLESNARLQSQPAAAASLPAKPPSPPPPPPPPPFLVKPRDAGNELPKVSVPFVFNVSGREVGRGFVDDLLNNAATTTPASSFGTDIRGSHGGDMLAQMLSSP